MKDPSMKRLAALIPLSRDHGVGLVCAQHGRKAVQASKDDRLALAELMRSICRDVIDPNLEEEQWLLTPMIPDNRMRAEFHQHHKDIRQLTSRLSEVELSQDPGLGLMARVANALDDYVRWEEHTLYPKIEKTINKEQLLKLSKLTSAVELQRMRHTQQLHSSIKLDQPSGLSPPINRIKLHLVKG